MEIKTSEHQSPYLESEPTSTIRTSQEFENVLFSKGTPTEAIAPSRYDEVAGYRQLSPEIEEHLRQVIQRAQVTEEQIRTGGQQPPKHSTNRIIQEGQNAAELLLGAHLHLVISIARGYQASGMELADLIQEGNWGLVSAFKKFDFSRNVKFSTFAYDRIHGAIKDALRRNNPLGRGTYKDLGILRKVEGPYADEIPSEADMQRYSEFSDEKRHYLRRMGAMTVISLDTPVNAADPDGATVSDQVADPEDLEDSIQLPRNTKYLDEFLSTLDESEKEVILAYYGLKDGRPQTLAEIGRGKGVSESRASQLKKAALAKLRTHHDINSLKEYAA